MSVLCAISMLRSKVVRRGCGPRKMLPMRTPGTTKNFSPSRDVMVINCDFSGGPQPAFTKSRNCLGSA